MQMEVTKTTLMSMYMLNISNKLISYLVNYKSVLIRMIMPNDYKVTHTKYYLMIPTNTGR